jgi:hypothetical protein
MDQPIPEPALWSFLLQLTVFMLPIPTSYLAYRCMRVPLRRDRIKQSLSQLGIIQTGEMEETMGGEYRLRHYAWPLVTTCLVTAIFYSLTHPYPIQRGVWAGLLEEVVDIFDADDRFQTPFLIGRFLFWTWMGAYIYSLQLTLRRFLAYDLTPSVYVFGTNRFLLAWVIACTVGTMFGTLSAAAGVPFDVNMATVYTIVFFIGLFPDQGLNWIVATAQKALKLQGGIAEETHLSEIDGLSIWHQARLKQESIENVQNLATAYVPGLVTGTPFPVNQIVDWVDQAILLTYTRPEQLGALKKVGLRCASDVLTAAGDSRHLNQLASATGLNKDGLRVLHLALQSAINIELVSRFRRQSSTETEQEEATALQPSQDSAPTPVTQMPREQEEVMFENEE